VQRARIQREAVAAIEKSQGRVLYDWDWTDGDLILRGKPSAPRWLVDLIGVDFFGRVTDVRLAQIEADEVIVQVGRLTQLKQLTVSAKTFSDAGLVHLTGLANLSGLDLSGTNVSDAGLTRLKGLTKLKLLLLRRTQVTGVGIKELKHTLPSLKNWAGQRMGTLSPATGPSTRPRSLRKPSDL
jgi:Leucine-rich repeat (LRR) protein